MNDGAERRLALERMADALRPRLHRYASGLTGSVIDGEDVVQDTFVRAFAAIGDLPADTPLKPWLFRIAHNRGIDLLRSAKRWATEPIDPDREVIDQGAANPEDATLQREAVGLAVSQFAALPVPQRAAVILKDVLDEPLAEIATLLELSVDAVKAHLARGRARLRALPAPVATAIPPPSPEALHFAALFNRQDWTGLRALLAEDVRLNQARRPLRHGAAEVGRFFTFYEAYPPVRLEPAWLDGREVLLVMEFGKPHPSYFMCIRWRGDRIAEIRDHRYAGYIMEKADIRAAG